MQLNSNVLKLMGADFGVGAARALPQELRWRGKSILFLPKNTEMRIFLNIETTSDSETKTMNLNTNRNATMKTDVSIIYTL